MASRKAAALARTRETMRAALLSSGARRTFAIAVFVQVILAAIFEELRNQVAWLIVVGLISVLAAFGLIFCIATAYGRSCFGSYVAYSSRYTEYVELGILGLYLYTLGVSRNWLRAALPIIFAGMLAWGALPITRVDQYGMDEYREGKSEWRKCYLKTEDVHGCDVAVHFAVYPFPERTGLKEKLEYLKRTKQNLYSDAP